MYLSFLVLFLSSFLMHHVSYHCLFFSVQRTSSSHSFSTDLLATSFLSFPLLRQFLVHLHSFWFGLVSLTFILEECFHGKWNSGLRSFSAWKMCCFFLTSWFLVRNLSSNYCSLLALGQCWPSDHRSAGGSSASWRRSTVGNWNLKKQTFRQGGSTFVVPLVCKTSFFFPNLFFLSFSHLARTKSTNHS